MALTEEICSNWSTDITGHVHNIASLIDSPYPAWTVRLSDSYGVMMEYEGEEEINETFADARILSREIILNGGTKRVLSLTTSSQGIEETFSALCAAFVNPGSNGENRQRILTSPIEWWKNWKEMLGNRNIDARIYDVLGELSVLKTLLKSIGNAEWTGPDGASYDIETETGFVEVKSTVTRGKREVTISNQFQLNPEGKPLWLVLCQFEPTVLNGISIDSVVRELSDMGYDTSTINAKLEGMGLEEGMSSRKKTFLLHGMLKYVVGSDFPKITPASFIGGNMPPCITKITYTVDLSGMPAESILEKTI